MPSLWRDIIQSFSDGAIRHPDLCAHWEPKDDLWTFHNGPKGQPVGPADPEAEKLFRAISALAIRLANKQSGLPAYHAWLNLMRENKRGFRHVLKPRRFHRDYVPLINSEGPSVSNHIPRGPDGFISALFQDSAEFCRDYFAGGEPASGTGSGPGASAFAKRSGPNTDIESALRVERIVLQIAPKGKWKDALESICSKLDEEGIRQPKPWKAKGYTEWADVATIEKGLVVKAIQHHLKNARNARSRTIA